MKVLILHAYSRANSGDGVLVDEAKKIIRESIGECTFELVALHPESFESSEFDHIYSSQPTKLASTLRTLRKRQHESHYDLIVGVGGGYLRFGTFKETLKTSVIHLPQLVFAARQTTTPTIYLPQSIGPFRWMPARLVRRALKNISRIYLRDGKSMREVDLPNCLRSPDLALLTAEFRNPSGRSGKPVVFGTRELRRQGRKRTQALAKTLAPVEGFIQSEVGNNNDISAVAKLNPVNTLFIRDLERARDTRTVVSVRLHGALMALNAGHRVVHLSYERKGFGAFQDLGLEEFVYNVNRFNGTEVAQLTDRLHVDEKLAAQYDSSLDVARRKLRGSRNNLVQEIRTTFLEA